MAHTGFVNAFVSVFLAVFLSVFLSVIAFVSVLVPRAPPGAVEHSGEKSRVGSEQLTRSEQAVRHN